MLCVFRIKLERPVNAKTPAQHDDWSCGHRMVLILHYLLHLHATNKLQGPLPEIEIPNEVLSEKALRRLCVLGVAGLRGLDELAASQAAAEGDELGQPSVPATGASSAKQDMETGLKREGEDVMTESGSACRPKREKSSDEQQTSEKKRSKRFDPEKEQKHEPACDRQQVKPTLVDDDCENNLLVVRAGDLLNDRPQKAVQKRRETQAKAVLKKAGLDFNKHFQVFHRGTAFAGRSEHWKEFLNGVLGLRDITCDICVGLIKEYAIDIGSEQPTPQKKGKRKESAAVSAPDDLVSPPKKRGRAGRPSKDEAEAQKFSLLDYLTERRPDQYRFLDREEAAARLPKSKSAGENALTIEMQKRPVQCMVCGIFLHFPCLTNTLALWLGLCAVVCTVNYFLVVGW